MIGWVFGGTAAGKKHFIARAVETPEAFGLPAGIRPFWIEDGERSFEELEAAADQSSLMVRWQWGREARLAEVARNYPAIKQVVYLVRTPLHIQMQRVVDREGFLKWDDDNLRGEAQEIERLAATLSKRHRLRKVIIDGRSKHLVT